MRVWLIIRPLDAWSTNRPLGLDLARAALLPSVALATSRRSSAPRSRTDYSEWSPVTARPLSSAGQLAQHFQIRHVLSLEPVMIVSPS